MARVGLSVSLTVSSDCETITLNDITGLYPTVSTGYGLTGGITVNDVDGLVIVVTLGDGSYLTYTFTIVNGTITAATLGLSGAAATSILSELESTVFPLVNFDLFADYGVTVPDVTDGIYSVAYTITGDLGPTPFSYTASKSTGVFCSLCCCLSKKALDIDPNCDDCFKNKMMNYLYASTFAKVSKYALQVGKTADAILAFDKATDLCACNCDC